MSIDRFLGAIIILWVFLRTLSYGRWTWKKKNKLGGVMVMLLAFATVLLTIYQVFLKE